MDLKRDEVAEVILNQLYKFTAMETTFGIILLAIVNNRPQIMDLKTILVHFLDFGRRSSASGRPLNCGRRKKRPIF